jgi:ATP-binding cassette, subfamily B, bacterial
MAGFPNYKQPDEMDCGPTCLRIIAKFHGRHFSLESIRKFSETTREGSSLYGLSEAAEKLGFRTLGAKLSFNQLSDKQAPLPCVVHWRNRF